MLFKAGDVVQQVEQLPQLLFIGHWSWREFFVITLQCELAWQMLLH